MGAYTLHGWQSFKVADLQLHQGQRLPLNALNLYVCAGLLGGAVYVNAFTLISRQVDPLRREFSLAAASLGDSLGIAFADIAGILIQGCLYKANKTPGATFSC